MTLEVHANWFSSIAAADKRYHEIFNKNRTQMCLRTMNSRGWGISIALHRGCRALSGLPGLLKTKIQIRIMPQSATALIKYALKAAT